MLTVSMERCWSLLVPLCSERTIPSYYHLRVNWRRLSENIVPEMLGAPKLLVIEFLTQMTRLFAPHR
jgi:hypothetical protein